jgi:anaerobic selenocysteine-containing dehydrogenase
MVHVMMRDGLIDEMWLDEHTADWENLRASAAEMSLDKAVAITGLDASRIEWLAHTYVAN